MGETSNRDAVGARVRLALTDARGDARTLTRWVEAGSGYATQAAYPVHFGLGSNSEVTAVEVRWPSGRVQRWDGAALGKNRVVRLVETGT